MTYTSEMLSPRELSASRHWLPFGASKRPDDNKVAWVMCGGLVAAATPGRKRFVKYSDLFGVVWDKATRRYVIVSYWPEQECSWMQKPYALSTLRRYVSQGKLVQTGYDIKWDDLEAHFKKRYPILEMPSKKDFFMQFGVPFVEVHCND